MIGIGQIFACTEQRLQLRLPQLMPKRTDGTARKFRRWSVLDSLSSRDLADMPELLIGCTIMELKVPV